MRDTPTMPISDGEDALIPQLRRYVLELQELRTKCRDLEKGTGVQDLRDQLSLLLSDNRQLRARNTELEVLYVACATLVDEIHSTSGRSEIGKRR